MLIKRLSVKERPALELTCRGLGAKAVAPGCREALRAVSQPPRLPEGGALACVVAACVAAACVPAVTMALLYRSLQDLAR
jgi:hypothetical protein